MSVDMIVGILVFIVFFVLEILAMKLDISFLKWMHSKDHQVGAKLMAAFLVGFIVFIIFTDKMTGVGQKISVIIVALLLIWANLFLVKSDPES
jgi:hypothetical protein